MLKSQVELKVGKEKGEEKEWKSLLYLISAENE
jgi:hypothetical protein